MLNRRHGLTALAVAALIAPASAGAVSFRPAATYPAGAKPYSLAVVDLNGDRRPDVATADQASHAVSVFLGDGAGRLRRAVSFPAGPGPSEIVHADFNRDGRADLAVANFAGNDVGGASVLLGRGDGTFAPPITYATAVGTFSVAAGDVNGDRIVDLLTADGVSNTVSVLFGNGDGTFRSGGAAPVPGTPVAVVLLGGALFATANHFTRSVGVFAGDGRGAFVARSRHTVGADPYAIAAGRIDRNASVDLVAVNQGGDTVSVLLGGRNGAFGAPRTLAVGPNPTDVAIGDLDRDARADLATSNYGASTLSILLGNGRGGFRSGGRFRVGAGPSDVVRADLNRDGRPDLVTANDDGNSVSVLLNSTPKRRARR